MNPGIFTSMIPAQAHHPAEHPPGRAIPAVLGLYDGDIRGFGHDIYFNHHLLHLLSPIFREIVFFGSIDTSHPGPPELPSNVKMVEIPAEVQRENTAFFPALWRFMNPYGCDLLLLSSEGVFRNNRRPFCPPGRPYMICIHIVWKMLQLMKEDAAIARAIRQARTVFVLEDYLRKAFEGLNPNVFRLPFFVFGDHFQVAVKRLLPPLQIATIGIINDRRNVDFLLRALAEYEGPPFTYLLAGKPIGKAGEAVSALTGRLEFPGNVTVHTRLEYLSDGDYESALAGCDFALVAYDEARGGQAPGILYRASNHNSVLIAPRIEPFTFYEQAYSGLIAFYENLSAASLNRLLATLAAGGEEAASIQKNAEKARERFVEHNQTSHQRRLLKDFFQQKEISVPAGMVSTKSQRFINGIGKFKHKLEIFLWGSKYNCINATDKYCGSRGKIKAWMQISKARMMWKHRDAPRLRALKDIHAGASRCFIIGNGPSINGMDLSRLRHEITFGVNGIYLNFPQMGFKPSYYVVEDNLVAEDRGPEINRLHGMTKFFALRLAYCLRRDQETIFLNHNPDGNPWKPMHLKHRLKNRFSPDASLATFGGNTVLYTCLQLAFHFGIRQVYLIGCDHNLVVPEEYKGRDAGENFVIESTADDVNHFHPAYFGKGCRWHNPKLPMIEESFKTAKKFFEIHGGKIFNATKGGRLEVFERADFGSLFADGRRDPEMPRGL